MRPMGSTVTALLDKDCAARLTRHSFGVVPDMSWWRRTPKIEAAARSRTASTLWATVQADPKGQGEAARIRFYRSPRMT